MTRSATMIGFDEILWDFLPSGQEVLHVMRSSKAKESGVRIYAKQAIVSCPGRERTDDGRGGVAGTYTEGNNPCCVA